MADSIRIADSIKMVKENSMGIWEIGNYSDEFGDPTKNKFIANANSIYGTFSNSATEGSDLRVRFLIDDHIFEEKHFLIIQLQLYEYAGSNPVKEGLNYGYEIKVRTIENEVIDLDASNYSDRLSLGIDDSKKLSEILFRGGQVKFSIIEKSKYSKSSYKFVLENVSGFNNAVKKLME